MFLRRYTRTKDGKTHTYYALVESVRTESGPRQHVVAYLGELNHDQERRWQRTVVFHNRQVRLVRQLTNFLRISAAEGSRYGCPGARRASGLPGDDHDFVGMLP